MNEFRKFIRFIVPVLVFVFYSYSLLALIYGEITCPENRDLPILQVSAVIFPLLGALGFLISSVHHLLFWYCPIYPSVRHQQFLQRLTHERELVFIGQQPNLFDEMSNWNIINVIWHSLRTKDSTWDKINQRNDSLTDLMHSTGAIFVAYLLALVFAIVFAVARSCCYGQPPDIHEACFCIKFITLFVLIVLLFILHCVSLRRTSKNMETFVQTALFHILRLQNIEKGGQHPYRFYTSNA